VSRLGGRDIIAGGLLRGRVRIWSEHGDIVGDLSTSLTGRGAAVAVGRLCGRDVIITGGCGDGKVRIWDADGHPIGDPFTGGPTSQKIAVAIGRLRGRDVIVTAGHDAAVRIWDTAARSAITLPTIHSPRHCHSR